MARSSDSGKAGMWRTRMGRFIRSGLTVARFCEQEGVSTASFYWWRRRLAIARSPGSKAAGRRRASPQTVNTPRAANTPRGDNGCRAANMFRTANTPRAVGSAENDSLFQIVRVTPTVANVSIHLPGGARVEVPTANRGAIRDILRELTRRGATPGGGEPAC